MTVYLDNAATTKPCEAAISAAVHCMKEHFGNPSSLHKMGIAAETIVNDARRSLAESLSCDPSRLFFTSGATESNNLAILGAADVYGRRKNKIITTSAEHPSVSEPISALEKQGFEVVKISPQNGKFLPEDFINAADENTFLISMMIVNNETGIILPVQKVFSAIKRRFPDIITHCDLVQGFMKLPLRLSNLCADMATISSHKVYAPKGAGALYISKNSRITPRIFGGQQEKGLRSGTEAVPAIAGFGEAVKWGKNKISINFESALANKKFILKNLEQFDNISLNSPLDEDFLPYIINFSVRGVRSEIMLHYLEERDIFVSSGSACSKGTKKSVLKNLGISNDDADCALRVSLAHDTTTQELEIMLNALSDGVKKLVR